MNIYALHGRKVKVTKESASQGTEFNIQDVVSSLELDTVYTVDHTDIGGFSTSVCLVELPGRCFNSVNFVDVEPQSEEDDQEHPQWDDYN